MKRTPMRRRKSAGKDWRRNRQWVFDRAHGRCEAHATEDCTGRAEHAHHIILRSRCGSDDPSNLLAVCHVCHGWIHAHPALATEHGWMRQREAS